MTTLAELLDRLRIGSKELEQLHLRKLKRLLVSVNEKSPYYREKFAAAGVDPGTFTALEQFSEYPKFDKYEERESQARSLKEQGHPLGMHLSCDIRAVNRISASSGTTGTPSFQGHTRNDRAIINENFARLASVTGLQPGDRVMMAGVMSMWVAGIPTVDALLEYGANVIPIGGLVGAVKVIEMMQLTRPEVLVCTPSAARHIVRKAQDELNVDLREIGIRALYVYGEPGGSVPEIVAELSVSFGGAEVFDMAGGTGVLNPIFVSCREHAGMHFIAPDYAYIELFDREKDAVLPFAEGAEGEFVYTGLDRECGPLIRFMDGDRMRVRLETCTCGLPGMRISILGRVDDMLLVKGVNVFPTAVRDFVLGFGESVTGSVRIVRDGDGPVVEPPVEVRVECKGSPASEEKARLAADIEKGISRQLRFRASVTLYDEGDLPVIYGPTGKAKLLETRE
jgi:phenylacetate-CoA ligase